MCYVIKLFDVCNKEQGKLQIKTRILWLLKTKQLDKKIWNITLKNIIHFDYMHVYCWCFFVYKVTALQKSINQKLIFISGFIFSI